MEENDQAQAAPRLCRKGCGFYGSPNFDGFCSKCHRDMQATAENTKHINRIPTPIESSSNEDEEDYVNSNLADSSLLTETPKEERLPKPEAKNKVNKKFESLSTLDSYPQPPTESTPEEPGQKERPRCLTCNKRVGLTGFLCRCGGLFCTVHRYSDAHKCAFDYRESGQADIRKANPQVICSKINKI